VLPDKCPQSADVFCTHGALNGKRSAADSHANNAAIRHAPNVTSRCQVDATLHNFAVSSESSLRRFHRVETNALIVD
jgi:hypothetical protein